MKKVVFNAARVSKYLTKGKEYAVVFETSSQYKIIDNEGVHCFYDKYLFDEVQEVKEQARYSFMRLGHYTQAVKLNEARISNREQRLECLNEILFSQMRVLNKEQIIIFYEDMSGGEIWGSKEHAQKAYVKMTQNLNGYVGQKGKEVTCFDGQKKIEFKLTKVTPEDSWNLLNSL